MLILNVKAACRVCLAVGRDMTFIFDESSGMDLSDSLSLPSRISACLGFEVTQRDNLPSQICNICLRSVDSLFAFRAKAQSMNELLLQLTTKRIQIVSKKKNPTPDPVEVKSNSCPLTEEPAHVEKSIPDSVAVVKSVEANRIYQQPEDGVVFPESGVKSTDIESDPNIEHQEVDGELYDINEDLDEGKKDDSVTDNDADDFSFEDENDEDAEGAEDISWRHRPVKCPLCFRPCKNHESIKYHLKQRHFVVRIFPCFICGHVSLKTVKRREHISKKHSNLERNTCHLCGVHTNLRNSFNRHMRKHKEDLRCDLCGMTLETLEDLEEHKKSVHQVDKVLEEPPPGVSLSYSCHLCENVSFWRSRDWKDHYREVHNSHDVFPCGNCNKAFNSKAARADHFRTHTGEKPFMCAECAVMFSSKGALKNHMKKHTERFKCEVCHSTFVSKGNLDYHMGTHSGHKPFVCEHCGKAFKSIGGLKFHATSHSAPDERPFKCDLCDFASRSYQGLHVHKVKHTNEKPFKCEKCDKSFKLKNWMKTHMKTHEKDVVYVCDVCHKTFARKDSLTAHLKRHNEEMTAISSIAGEVEVFGNMELT